MKYKCVGFVTLAFLNPYLVHAGRLLFENKVSVEPQIQKQNEPQIDELTKANSRTPAKKPALKRPNTSHLLGGESRCNLSQGNLPKEFSNICRSEYQASMPISIVAEKQRGARLGGLRVGDMLIAYMEQSIKASPNIKTPIRAIIQGGTYDGGILHGYASLDPVLKRVMMDFEHLRIAKSSSTYKLIASGHALNGQVGLKGDYNSGENRYVATAFAVDFASAMLDASVQRNITVYGTQVPDQSSVSNRIKGSAAVATAKEGERLLEKARNAPEWTEIPGGQEIQVFVNSDVTEELNE